jgi:hypothetical protein
MLTRYEQLFSKRDNWVSLGDLYDEENQLNLNFQYFLEAFSAESNLIFVSLIPYGVLSGMEKNKVKADVNFFTWNGLINNIQEYLNKDGFIVYPLSVTHSTYEDYPKGNKRQDFFDRIHIIQKNNKVPFSNICHIDPSKFTGFRIQCNINSNGQYRRDIDFLENWSNFEQDDLIDLAGDLVPRIYFEEL